MKHVPRLLSLNHPPVILSCLLASLALGFDAGLRAQDLSTVKQDLFTHIASNINNQPPTTGTGVWTTWYSGTNCNISVNGSQAVMNTNIGGTPGDGQAIANIPFNPAPNTIYRLTTTLAYTTTGTASNSFAAVGFSNVLNGAGGKSENNAPWMFIAPQAKSTDATWTNFFIGPTSLYSENLPATYFSIPIAVTITWNTGNGVTQYYVNDVLQYTGTTVVPTGQYYVFFQGFKTGNAVNVNNITLTAQPQRFITGSYGVQWDYFGYTTANINGHADGWTGTWNVNNYNQSNCVISANGSQATMSINGGAIGSGQAIANCPFTLSGDRFYTLTVVFLFTGPIGAGHDCWAGMGISNQTNGGNNSNNPGPWMLIRPQGVSTDNPQVASFYGSTCPYSGSVPAVCYSSPITATICWDTFTGQAQYYINNVLQPNMTATTPLPTSGTFNMFFQGFQTGNSVNVKSIVLNGQNLPGIVNQVQFYPAPGHESSMVGGQIIASNAVGLPTVWGGDSTMPSLNLYDVSNPSMDQFVTLATITSQPAAGQWTTLPLTSNTTSYRWIGYLAPAGSYGYVADIDFYSGNQKVTGNEFSSFPNVSTTDRIATDGDPGSVYWGYNSSGVYAGLDTVWNTTGNWPGLSPTPSVRIFAPTINPQPTIFNAPVTVTLNNGGVPNSTIRYTLDGTIPTATHGTVYSGAFVLNQTTTVEAATIVPGLADSQALIGTYIINPTDKPLRNSFHIGNSLTQAAGSFDLHAATAGDPHTFVTFGIGGALTITLWNAKTNSNDPNYQNWLNTWGSITTAGIQGQLSDFTMQPRDFTNDNEDEEAQYDLLWLNFVQGYSPNVQPWLYAEWTEFNRQRPTDLGLQATYEMTTVYPALTWEESMGAMLLYNEDVRTKVNQTYTGSKPIRIIPAALAMGWLHNQIQNGTFPLTPTGLAPGDFYTQFFRDQVHPNQEGCFLVEMVWYAAFYGQSPVGKVLPIGTNLTPAQATAMEQLAWDAVSNYPYAGVYVAGGSPAAAPTFSQTGHVTVNTPITLSSTTSGAWFRYTLDGTTPTDTKGYVYCGVITVRPGMTVKAIAYKNGMTPSAVSTSVY